jgi:hypothetical protein
MVEMGFSLELNSPAYTRKPRQQTLLLRGLAVNRLSLNPLNNKAGATCNNTPDTPTLRAANS